MIAESTKRADVSIKKKKKHINFVVIKCMHWERGEWTWRANPFRFIEIDKEWVQKWLEYAFVFVDKFNRTIHCFQYSKSHIVLCLTNTKARFKSIWLPGPGNISIDSFHIEVYKLIIYKTKQRYSLNYILRLWFYIIEIVHDVD